MSDVEQIEPWAVAVEGEALPLVLEHINEYAVTVEAGPELLVLTAGEQGPPGPQGIPGPAGGAALQKVAAVPLSGHRLVFSTDGAAVDYADCSALANRSNTLGMTLGAAEAGALVNVQRSGEVVFEGWAWGSGPVFLGHDGPGHATPAARRGVLTGGRLRHEPDNPFSRHGRGDHAGGLIDGW